MTDKQTNKTEGQHTTGVWRQWRVTWLIEHSTSHQLLWCIDSLVLRNPPLRQAPKRCSINALSNIVLISLVFHLTSFSLKDNG